MTERQRWYRAEYLTSLHWARKKQEKQKQVRRDYGRLQCERCGTYKFAEPFHVHHLASGYARLWGEMVAVDLRLECAPCHRAEHGLEEKGAA